jgi:spermidine synthase
MTMAALLFNRDPQKILIVGLGGGTLPEAFFDLLDNARIDTVEIDPAVIKVAKEYFLFEDNERKRVIAQDARVFIKRAILQSTEYDLVILDAFNGDYIPEHLMTKEFLLEVQKVLSRDGVLVANTFGTSKLYDYESNTYQDVFGSFINYKRPETGNRLIIVPQAKLDFEEREPIDAADLIQTARELESKMSELEVPIIRYARELPRKMVSRPDWDQNTEIITDQFSPVNLLRRQSRD